MPKFLRHLAQLYCPPSPLEGLVMDCVAGQCPKSEWRKSGGIPFGQYQAKNPPSSDQAFQQQLWHQPPLQVLDPHLNWEVAWMFVYGVLLSRSCHQMYGSQWDDEHCPLTARFARIAVARWRGTPWRPSLLWKAACPHVSPSGTPQLHPRWRKPIILPRVALWTPAKDTAVPKITIRLCPGNLIWVEILHRK